MRWQACTWMRWRALGVAAVTLALLGGCADPASVVGFQEIDPGARLRAIRQAAATNDRAAVPSLINELESDDPAERLLAIRALEKITGQTLGYDHAAGVEDRQEGVRRWVAWYSQQPKMTTNGNEGRT
jgi:HEAT repeat protein